MGRRGRHHHPPPAARADPFPCLLLLTPRYNATLEKQVLDMQRELMTYRNPSQYGYTLPKDFIRWVVPPDLPDRVVGYARSIGSISHVQGSLCMFFQCVSNLPGQPVWHDKLLERSSLFLYIYLKFEFKLCVCVACLIPLRSCSRATASSRSDTTSRRPTTRQHR